MLSKQRPRLIKSDFYFLRRGRRARRVLFQSATRRQAFRRHDTPRWANHFLKEPDFATPLRGGASPNLGRVVQSRLFIFTDSFCLPFLTKSSAVAPASDELAK